MNHRKSYYVPAYSVGADVTAFFKNHKKINTDKSFRYYNKDGVFYYPYLLVSVAHNYKKENYVNDINLDLKNTFLLGDSGGYQIATGQVSAKEEYLEKFFNWLENNTTYALNIDIPMYINVKSDVMAQITIEEKLKISKTNFDYFQKHQTGKTNFLNVLHGRNPKDLKLWYDFCKNYNFPGGFAIGSANVNVYYILQSFFFLLKNGDLDKMKNKNCILHILGLSRPESMIIIEYLQKKLNEYDYNIAITYDSSSPGLFASMGNYVLSIDKNSVKKISFSKYFKLNQEVKLPCSCPVCKGLKFKDYYNNRNDKDGFITLVYNHFSFHNLYKFLEYKMMIERIVNAGEFDFYEAYFDPKFIFIFKLIDEGFKDIENSVDLIHNNKYKLMNRKKEKYTQKGVIDQKALF